MNGGTLNIHATAVVLGTRGILFTGPSGSGKSMLAFACIAANRSCMIRVKCGVIPSCLSISINWPR